MNYGVIATLLIRLDARLGRWEAVADLAAHLGIADAGVCAHLEQLLADGLVRVERSDKSGAIVAAMVEPASVHAEAACW